MGKTRLPDDGGRFGAQGERKGKRGGQRAAHLKVFEPETNRSQASGRFLTSRLARTSALRQIVPAIFGCLFCGRGGSTRFPPGAAIKLAYESPNPILSHLQRMLQFVITHEDENQRAVP